MFYIIYAVIVSANSVVHESLDGVITMSQEEFTLREIRRLKMEMDNCMSQMKKIEDVAKNGKDLTLLIFSWLLL